MYTKKGPDVLSGPVEVLVEVRRFELLAFPKAFGTLYLVILGKRQIRIFLGDQPAQIP